MPANGLKQVDPVSNCLQIHTDTAENSRSVGFVIGSNALPGDVYLLTGPLGAGKTCLIQGIARGLGVSGHARSPTFVLMTRYQGRLTLHHVDLYRIEHPLEAWDLGLEDVIAANDAVLAVEWADRAADLFPEDGLWIAMDYAIDPNPACEVIPDDEGSVPGRHSITIGNFPSRFAPLLRILAENFDISPANTT
jgi:tRNA threonylcarbamoyladenosine biosynthesis protein TsaE